MVLISPLLAASKVFKNSALACLTSAVSSEMPILILFCDKIRNCIAEKG